jgi:hypothetical protein
MHSCEPSSPYKCIIFKCVLGFSAVSLSNILCCLRLYVYVEVRTIVVELSQYRSLTRNLICTPELNIVSHHIQFMYFFKPACLQLRCYNRNTFRPFATNSLLAEVLSSLQCNACKISLILIFWG